MDRDEISRQRTISSTNMKIIFGRELENAPYIRYTDISNLGHVANDDMMRVDANESN